MSDSACCMKCGGDILVGPALCCGCAPKLAERNAKLLAALRGSAISYRTVLPTEKGHILRCSLCRDEWYDSEASERHAAGCLAALQSEGSDR